MNVDTSQDQLDRILKDFIALGKKSVKPANVACRCTVFTKSDMIHLQNRGEKLEDIIYGLHVGNARNYMSTIVSNRLVEAPVVFVGGLSLNELQVKALREYIPELEVPPYNTSIGALGVALATIGIYAVGKGKWDRRRESPSGFIVARTTGKQNGKGVCPWPRGW